MVRIFQIGGELSDWLTSLCAQPLTLLLYAHTGNNIRSYTTYPRGKGGMGEGRIRSYPILGGHNQAIPSPGHIAGLNDGIWGGKGSGSGLAEPKFIKAKTPT